MRSEKKYLNSFMVILVAFFTVITTNRASEAEEIIVSAAASLTGIMKKISQSYEASNPAADLVFNFASSGSLLQQIRLGAPVDVYVSASSEFMDRAEKETLIQKETRQNFSAGRLVLITPADSALTITEMPLLLSQPVKRIAIGNPKTVPAGRYAKTALEHEGLWHKAEDKLIYGNSVRQVLDYTARGEVDAGFVYATDAISNNKVKIIHEVKNTGPIIYPVAVTSATKQKEAGIQFIEFLKSKTGQELFITSGFNRL